MHAGADVERVVVERDLHLHRISWSLALHRLHDEDPTLQTHYNAETHETIVGGQGERHIEVAMARLVRQFGVKGDLTVMSKALGAGLPMGSPIGAGACAGAGAGTAGGRPGTDPFAPISSASIGPSAAVAPATINRG